MATYKYLDLAGLQTYDGKLKAFLSTNYAPKTHTHNYAGSSSAGGAATSALKLSNTTAIGSSTKPVYFSANGVPIAVTNELATQASVNELSDEVLLKAPINNPTFTGTPTAPTANKGTNTTQIATTAYVKTEIDSVLQASDAMRFKGTLGTGGTVTSLPTSHSVGDTYKVITAGTYAGAVCSIGDMIICIKDGTTASNSDWTVVQANIDGAVTGPSSSVDNRVAVFNGTTGKIIKDSGYTIATSVPRGALFSDTTYTFAGGTEGSFTVTPKGGDPQTVSIGKPATAGTADDANTLGGKAPSHYAASSEIDNILVQLAKKAPNSHAATTDTYGLGTATKYGHVKLVSGDLNGKSAGDGMAAAQNHTHSQYLTSHQTIYNLTMQAGTFSAVTFDPNGAAKTVNIPTLTSHLTNDSNFITKADLDSTITANTDASTTITTGNVAFLSSVVMVDGAFTNASTSNVMAKITDDEIQALFA